MKNIKSSDVHIFIRVGTASTQVSTRITYRL